MHARFVLTLAAAFLATAATLGYGADAGVLAELASSGRVHPLVLEQLGQADRVRVFLELDLKAAGAGAHEEQSWQGRRPWVQATREVVASDLAPQGFHITHRFEGLSFVAGWIDSQASAAALRHPLVRRILPDSGGSKALLQSLPLANLSDTRAAGLTGAGVTVAVIDSGVQKSHPALVGSVVAEACYCSEDCCPNGNAEQHGSGAAADGDGHGTNVTGIIASGGGAGAPVGATPDVDIVAVRVLDDDGFFSTTADIAMALDWVRQWSDANNEDVAAVNMSLATNLLSQGNCDSTFIALAQAADAIRDIGVLPVAASGNNGSGTMMAAPACISDVASVAAVWDANVGSPDVFCQEPSTAPDKITCFSNRNQLTDLLAPGAPVTSTGLGSTVSTFFGTSQAAPMVTACAAALRQADEDLSPSQMLTAMVDSPTRIFDPLTGRSIPRLDCLDAVMRVAGTTTTTLSQELCGDADGNGSVVASDALTVLHAAVGLSVACPPSRCDFDGSGTIAASDALSTLKRAVGQSVNAGCSAEA